MNPTTTYHARGLTKLIDAHYNAIWKELQNLERAGLVESEATAHLRAYRLNPNCPIHKGDEAALRKTDSAKTHQSLSGETRRNKAAAETRRARPRNRGA
jgi:hypothetical protein